MSNTIVAAVAAFAASISAEGFQSMQIEVNKKVVKAGKAEYSKVGDVVIYAPLLSAFGIATIQAADDKGALLADDDGFPVYTDDKLNWLQGSIVAAVKAMARNRLKPGTAELKDGVTIASTFEELLAAADRSNSGAALVAIRELKSKFGEWVATLGKSAAAQQTLKTLFNAKDSLALQSETNRDKMAQYVSDFAATLDEATLAKSEKYLQGLLDACATNVDADDF
jgi:hypothetical protein